MECGRQLTLSHEDTRSLEESGEKETEEIPSDGGCNVRSVYTSASTPYLPLK